VLASLAAFLSGSRDNGYSSITDGRVVEVELSCGPLGSAGEIPSEVERALRATDFYLTISRQ